MSRARTLTKTAYNPWRWLKDVGLLLLGIYTLVQIGCEPAAAAVPQEAAHYQRTLVRAAHHGMGLDAPIATLAAQVHQESRWRTAARSPVGASGIAQFMPTTAQWMAELYPALGPADPYNPGWALRAMVQYNQWHLQRLTDHTRSPCENWALALSAYNGGLGWVYRDRALALASGASGLVWFDDIERFNAGRSAANFAENRHYVRAILLQWEPMYAAAGWGRGVCS